MLPKSSLNKVAVIRSLQIRRDHAVQDGIFILFYIFLRVLQDGTFGP